MNNLDWNDLRYVTAIARAGSAAAAARVLGVSPSTVLRRVQAIEGVLGASLFARQPSGYVVTEAGQTLAELGDAVQSALMHAGQRINSLNTSLEGTIRFTTTDSLGYTVMPGLLASFRARYPDIAVDMVTTNRPLDLASGRADVTLRVAIHPPESLIGMRLVRMDFAIYASPLYLEPRHGASWQDLDYIFPEGALEAAPSSRWLSSVVRARPMLKSNSFISLRALAREGVGAALLPRFLANLDPRLRLVEPAPSSASADIWVLTQPELRKSSRISVFVDHLARGLRDMRELFEVSAEH